MQNRSVPTDGALPHVHYDDVGAAIEWLSRVFGFLELYRYGDPARPGGAQIQLGRAVIQLHTTRGTWQTPRALGAATQMVTIIVDDVDAHHARTRAAGAEIDEPLNETVYGERQYSAIDLAGHRWMFSQHIRDADPTSWGAQIA